MLLVNKNHYVHIYTFVLSHSTSKNLSWRYQIPLQQCSNIHLLTVPPLTTSYICTIYLDHIYPQSLPYSSQSPPTHLPPTVMSYVIVWRVLPICTATTTLPHDPSFPSSHQLLIFLQLVMGTHDPPPFTLGCWLAWSHAGLVQTATAAVRFWVQPPRHI